MEPPRRSDRDDYGVLRKLEQAQASESLPEPTRPEEIRSPTWTHRGGMQDQQRSALEWAKLANERIQTLSQEQQQTPAEPPKELPQPQRSEQQSATQEPQEPTPEPERNQVDWRRLLSDEHHWRQVEDERENHIPQHQQSQDKQQARSDGNQLEKETEEKEIDWRRILSDPDYRREIKERDREVGQERIASQEGDEQSQSRSNFDRGDR
jgi:hypothetical protein